MTTGGATAVTLRLMGWVCVNALASLGMVVVASIAIGSFTLYGTMLQLNNLASRFVAADAARQAQFVHILVWALALTFFAIGLFRRKSAVDVVLSEVRM